MAVQTLSEEGLDLPDNRGISTIPKGCSGNPSKVTALFRATVSANGDGCTMTQPRIRPILFHLSKGSSISSYGLHA